MYPIYEFDTTSRFREIIEFLDKRISQLEKSQLGGEIKRFIDNLAKYFSEEEDIVFPLLLKRILCSVAL